MRAAPQQTFMADESAHRATKSATNAGNGVGGRFEARTAGDRMVAPGQACGCVMLTIQLMPNRSTHMPNSSPHICFSRGTDTLPPSESFAQ